MNNNLQLVLKSSTTEMSLNDHSAGIYLTPELDGLTGLPEIRTTSGVNAGYDGGWTSAQKFDARSIVIRGTIANNDKTEVERMRRELVALLAQGKNEQLELDFVTETGRAYEVQVRTIACDMALQKVLTQQDFMITLRADDPLIYDNSSAGEEATVNISGATGGFRIPFEIPLAIDAGSEETLVENTGLEAVAPTVKMYGALHNPKIINHTTNQSMQIQAELGFAEGAWINPVDAPEGTNVTFNPEMDAPIESVKLKGDTTQQTYTGKNLFNLNTSTKGNSGGNNAVSHVVSNSDLTITQTGNGGNGYVWFEIPNSDSLLGKTVSISVGSMAHSGTTSTGRIIIYTDNLSTVANFSSITSSGWSANFSFPSSYPSGASSFRVYAYLNNADTTTSVGSTTKFTNIQLELGSSTSSYEPYVGGVPAPNPNYPQAVQVVTGENTVKIHGKNLLKLPSAATSGGITYSVNSDGTFNVHGTNNSGYEILFSLYLGSSEFQSVNYTLGAREALPYGLGCRCEIYSGGTWRRSFVSVNYTRQTQTGTPDFTNANRVRVAITVANGATVNIDNVGIQLEKGSSASSFEPYQEQSYEVNLGKNLFDKDDASEILNGYIDTTFHATNSSRTVYVPCEPNTTYTVSKMASSRFVVATTAEVPAHGVQVSGAIQNNTATSITITTGATAKYIVAYMYNASYDTTVTPEQIIATLQIEKGSQATSYAAYFTPIELCKIGTYQDYIYKSGDKWYKHAEIGKTDLANYNYAVASTILRRTTDIPNMKYVSANTEVGSAIAEKYIIHEGRGMSAASLAGYMAVDVTMFAVNVGTSDTSVNPTGLLYYALATPTDTEITNAALIEQLEALVDGAAKVYAPTTHISTSSPGDLPNILAARYYTGKDPDQRDELIIDSRLRTITLNGLDVYHLKTDGSEFIMLAPGENKLSLQSDIVGDNGYAKVSYKQGYLSI